MRQPIFLFFSISILFSTVVFAQKKMGNANLQVLEPGEVKFPVGVKKLVLANRCYEKTFFPDKNEYSNLYELREILISAKSYSVEILQVDSSLRNKNPEKVAPPLDWNTVAKLVNHDTTSELVVLEQELYIRYDYAYEQQYGYCYPGYSYKNSNGDSAGFIYKNFYAYEYYPAYPYERTYISPFISTVGTGIKTGTQYLWKIYDLKTKRIIDDYEERTTDNYYFTNPITFPDAPDQYMLIYYNEEISYAYHLLPHLINANRDYYIEGSAEMKTANAFAINGEMDSAKVIWKKLCGDPDTKLARKACYNYALTFEIDSHLDSALAYAEKSKLLGDKNAPFYMATLRKQMVLNEKSDAEIKAGEGILPVIKYYRKKY